MTLHQNKNFWRIAWPKGHLSPQRTSRNFSLKRIFIGNAIWFVLQTPPRFALFYRALGCAGSWGGCALSLGCVRCCLLLFCILLQICFPTDWKKKCSNGVSPMRKLWSGWGGKLLILIFLQRVLMTFILKSLVVLRFVWIKTTSSFWANFDKVQRQGKAAVVSSARPPGSAALQGPGWLFQGYSTSAETIGVKITQEKALCQFLLSQNYLAALALFVKN